MASSQFTVYQSGDPGNGSDAPGLLVGSSNDLIRVLDKILVNGYTGKSAAGWSKPIANSGNLGCYKNGSGSGMTWFVNDNGPNATPSTREAWIIGYEAMNALTGTMGAGNGAFPSAALGQGSSGRLVVRKSADTTTGRSWICFADAYTCYFFVLSGDIANAYMGVGFGDLFSFKGSTDSYRAFTYGRSSENSNLASVGSDWDTFGAPIVTLANTAGMYVPRDAGGGGISSLCIRTCDYGLSSLATSTSLNQAVGALQTPNGADNAYYLDPVRVLETTGQQNFQAYVLRGRMRGLYHVCHAIAPFLDGQIITGANDYAGKTFQIVKQGPNTGIWAVEVSNTVETN